MKITAEKRFGFGKYRGHRVGEVAVFDPHYIWWVENNTEYRFALRVKQIARRSADKDNGSMITSMSRGFY